MRPLNSNTKTLIEVKRSFDNDDDDDDNDDDDGDGRGSAEPVKNFHCHGYPVCLTGQIATLQFC